jgi:mycoredoxin
VAAALTMYTTTWCAFCKRLKGHLAKAGIEIAEVNIEEDPTAAEYVMSVNGGFQTVPTVVFSDGSALTNPSAAAVSQRLAELAGTAEPAGRDSAQPVVAQPEVAQQ